MKLGGQFHTKEMVMQSVITAMTVMAGMVFSLAVALFVEELIFGEVFRLFGRHLERVRAVQKH